MKEKTALTIAFVLFLSVVLNINPNIIASADIYDNESDPGTSDHFVVQENIVYSSDDSENKKKSYGNRMGEIEGQLSGYMDSLGGRKNNWSKAIPSNKKIIERYNLDRETTAYRSAFLGDFRSSFREAYEKAFRDENFKDSIATGENGLVHGGIIGTLDGEAQGKLDYIRGKNNSWKSSIDNDSTIIKRYNLDRENFRYRESFLMEYKDGFREAYIIAFQDENMESSAGGSNTVFLSMHGGEVDSHDRAVKLKVEPGSFYEETGISISRTALYESSFGAGITPMPHSYNIRIRNVSNSVNLKKPVRIEFEYYGSENGGIYEYRNGRWLYLPGKIAGNKIYADIHRTQYSGGTYTVLIDDNYRAAYDTMGHWAAEPIDIFMRRGFIRGYPDKTFRPNQSITRAEFVKILDNVYNWSRRSSVGGTKKYFADSAVFGVFADSISRAVSLRYIKGYADNTFRPHIPITYQEVEWLMQRITGKPGFRWNRVAEQILSDHYVYSKSYNSKQNYITRAEVVYLLYFLEKEGN